jgi:hypothetical protein
MNYKNIFILLITLYLFNTSVAFSEQIYFSCNNIRMEETTNYKYEKSLFSSTFYEEQNGDWVNVEDWGIDVLIREDRIILDGYSHTSCSSVCSLRHVLPTLDFDESGTVNATTFIQNDCSYNFENFGCKQIHKGDVLKKSKCSVIFK